MEKEYAQSWNELWNYDTNKITGHNSGFEKLGFLGLI